MCYVAIGAAVLSAGTTLYASDQRADTQRQVAAYNARRQEIQAAEIARQGVAAENQLRQEAALKMSRQKAQAAASGVRVNTGGALQLREGVRLISNADALTLRQNFRNQSQSALAQSRLTRLQGEATARNTLLTGYGSALQAGISGYRFGSGIDNRLKIGGSSPSKTKPTVGAGGG